MNTLQLACGGHKLIVNIPTQLLLLLLDRLGSNASRDIRLKYIHSFLQIR